jgi:hypothetical protein
VVLFAVEVSRGNGGSLAPHLSPEQTVEAVAATHAIWSSGSSTKSSNTAASLHVTRKPSGRLRRHDLTEVNVHTT